MYVSPLEGAIANLQAAKTTPELIRATKSLCNLHTVDAISALIEVLGFNNPAVASVATAGLIELGSQAVPSLLVSLDEKNYGSRAWWCEPVLRFAILEVSTYWNMH